MDFTRHLTSTSAATLTVANSLSRLMPNARGPRARIRRLILSAVTLNKLLYGSPVWAHALTSNARRRQLERVRRTITLRISSAYRTVSGAALGVIACVPPIHLLAQERMTVHEVTAALPIPTTAARRALRHDSRTQLLETWQREWDEGTTGRWTHRLLPDIVSWFSRAHGDVSFHLTQALSGHGCFEAYLHRMRKCASPICRHCSEEADTAAHTLFRCPAWTASRYLLIFELGAPFDPDTFQERILASPAAFRAISRFVDRVLGLKEEEERLRQARIREQLRLRGP